MLDPLRLRLGDRGDGTAAPARTKKTTRRAVRPHQTLATSRTLSGLALSHTATTSSNATPPSTRPRYKYKFNKYRVPLFSGMCPVCRCPGSPAPPQYPSGALYGSRRPRPRPPRAPPRGRCPAHSSTPRCRRSPPCRRSRRPIASFATDTHAYLSAHA